MRCKRCGAENSYKAACCVGCGLPFGKEEQEAAYGKTFWGKVEKAEDVYNTLTLSKFLSSRPVRIVTLLLLLALGLFNILRGGGAHLRVEKGENYTVEYNRELNASYVITETEKLPVSIYLPHETEKIAVHSLNEAGESLETHYYTPEDPIVLEAGKADHFQIEAHYTKSGTESQLVYLFLTGKEGE